MKKISLFLWIGLFPFLCHAKNIDMGFIEPIGGEQANRVMLHSGSKISENSSVSFQFQNEAGQITCCIRVAGDAFQYKGESPKIFSDDGSTSGFLYQADPKELPYQKIEGFISTAIIDADSTKSDSNDSIIVTKNGAETRFERCYGTEGINLYEKSDGKVLSHLYYYLGYEIEPTCPDENAAKSK